MRVRKEAIESDFLFNLFIDELKKVVVPGRVGGGQEQRVLDANGLAMDILTDAVTKADQSKQRVFRAVSYLHKANAGWAEGFIPSPVKKIGWVIALFFANQFEDEIKYTRDNFDEQKAVMQKLLEAAQNENEETKAAILSFLKDSNCAYLYRNFLSKQYPGITAQIENPDPRIQGIIRERFVVDPSRYDDFFLLFYDLAYYKPKEVQIDGTAYTFKIVRDDLNHPVHLELTDLEGNRKKYGLKDFLDHTSIEFQK